MANDKFGTTQELHEFVDEPRTQVSPKVKGFRPRAHRAHMLRQIEGPGGQLRFVLDREALTLGRASNSDIQLDNDNVSRAHARLSRIDDEYTIEDLESRNGIYLNGLAVHSAVLRDGDEIHVGDFVFTYQEGT